MSAWFSCPVCAVPTNNNNEYALHTDNNFALLSSLAKEFSSFSFSSEWKSSNFPMALTKEASHNECKMPFLIQFLNRYALVALKWFAFNDIVVKGNRQTRNKNINGQPQLLWK